jgi:hypothetical protein
MRDCVIHNPSEKTSADDIAFCIFWKLGQHFHGVTSIERLMMLLNRDRRPGRAPRARHAARRERARDPAQRRHPARLDRPKR